MKAYKYGIFLLSCHKYGPFVYCTFGFQLMKSRKKLVYLFSVVVES